MKDTVILALLEKYRLGTCTEEELLTLEKWYSDLEDEKKLLPIEDNSTEAIQLINDMLFEFKLRTTAIKKPLVKRMWPRAAAAAMVLLALSVSFYIYKQNNKKTNTPNIDYAKNIKPGGNKAILTLADGSKITLDSAANGKLAVQANVKVSKLANGQLLYSVNAGGNPDEKGSAYNTITTPNGGEYQIVLEDGTKIWLNAASSLRYPLKFSGSKRVVTLTGEAYFEVAKNPQMPFSVKTAQQEVVVLGTHFNINSYADEPSVKTTLLEGSVKVINNNSSVVIKPGEQTQVVQNLPISIATVDTRESVAWKNGLFSFKRADIKSVMRQIARWYDVDVAYYGEIPKTTITGKIHRNVSISQMLESIGYLGPDLKIENRKITIKPETQPNN